MTDKFPYKSNITATITGHCLYLPGSHSHSASRYAYLAPLSNCSYSISTLSIASLILKRFSYINLWNEGITLRFSAISFMFNESNVVILMYTALKVISKFVHCHYLLRQIILYYCPYSYNGIHWQYLWSVHLLGHLSKRRR